MVGERKKMFKIGDILTKENYTDGAIWCNKNGAIIEKQGGYISVSSELNKGSEFVIKFFNN